MKRQTNQLDQRWINMTNYDVFHQWLEQCPVSFDYLSEDKSDDQIAYVFHINSVKEKGGKS